MFSFLYFFAFVFIVFFSFCAGARQPISNHKFQVGFLCSFSDHGLFFLGWNYPARATLFFSLLETYVSSKLNEEKVGE